MDWGKIQRPPEDSVSCNEVTVCREHKTDLLLVSSDVVAHRMNTTAMVL